MTTTKLQTDYEKSVNAYLTVFAKKYELDIRDTYWIGENGFGTGILNWGDMYLNFSDIKEDVDKNYDCFIKWYWETVEAQTKDDDKKQYINLFSYNLGLRYEMPTDQQKLLTAGFKIGSSKGLEEVVYSKKMNNKTTLNVVYFKTNLKKMLVYLTQKHNKVYLHNINNIEQLFQFQNQLQ
jgi:hypothetical protein